jgi:hypothetical protein
MNADDLLRLLTNAIYSSYSSTVAIEACAGPVNCAARPEYMHRGAEIRSLASMMVCGSGSASVNLLDTRSITVLERRHPTSPCPAAESEADLSVTEKAISIPGTRPATHIRALPPRYQRGRPPFHRARTEPFHPPRHLEQHRGRICAAGAPTSGTTLQVTGPLISEPFSV